MEENQNSGELLDRLEDWLSRKRMASALQKGRAKLSEYQKQFPGSAGFITGYTACARRQIKALVLLFCGLMIGLFSLLAKFAWGWFGAAFCAALAVVLWGIALGKRRASPAICYTDEEIHILSQTQKAQVVLTYPELTEIYVHGEQAALCTADSTWVLTAAQDENLKEMRAFLEKLAERCPGRTFTDDET